MERTLGVEEARGRLGQLVDEVSSGAEPVTLVKRGRTMAVLISRDEYARLKELSTRMARTELRQRLSKVRAKVRKAGLDAEDIEAAIQAAEHLE